MTSLAVFSLSEAHLTLAAVAARSIQALAVLTQVDVIGALVHV